jgi:DNA polymerase III alpha subunit
LRQLRATTVRDLAVANAFFKPGPATGGMADAFVRRYRGEEPATFLHPAVASIVAPTYGVLLFQEQVLRLAVEVADLDWAQANQLRKGMSKFQPAAMAALAEQFMAGCRRPTIGMSRQQAETLWRQVVAFAGYGFNQGHATAYADVSYRSAWLKAHYPAAFLAARLAHGGGYYHPAVYVAEARRLGLIVNPPHVNHSRGPFSLASGSTAPTLWMGLGWIRDLRRQSVRAIEAGQPFQSLVDLLRRVPLHEKEVMHLIQAGALDGLGPHRAALLAEAALTAGQGAQLAFAFAQRPEAAADSAAKRLAWEQLLLGFPVSVHPLATASPPADAVPLREVARHAGQTVTVAGVRLPSWDAGGFLFDDGTGLVRAVFPRSRQGELRRPPAWHPTALTGQWRQDRFGNTAFVALAVAVLESHGP